MFKNGPDGVRFPGVRVEKEGPVWTIESTLKFKQDVSLPRPYVAYHQESESIVRYLVRDKLIAKK